MEAAPCEIMIIIIIKDIISGRSAIGEVQRSIEGIDTGI